MTPAVVSRDEWEQARAEVAELELAEAEARDRALAARRELPAVRIGEPYEFAGDDGTMSFVDLFQGRDTLVLYHFMYAPEWTAGCPHCTAFAEGISPGVVRWLAEQGTTIALASRAPVERLDEWRAKHGWQIPWYSISDEFARDFGSLGEHGDRPMINVFTRDGDDVLHTFRGEGREVELVQAMPRWLDFTRTTLDEG